VKLLIGNSAGTEGSYKWSTGLDATHRRESRILGVFSTWTRGGGLPPWRLTADDVNVLDARMKTVLWPHYIDRLSYRGFSVWKRFSRIWKTRRKMLFFLYLLPTQLRGFVPTYYKALCLFVFALRRLAGQVHSYQNATNMGILPGSRTLTKSELTQIHRDLIVSLCLFEGCIPLSYLHPALHHFVHYVQYSTTHGLLRIFWMMCFERCVCVVRVSSCYYKLIHVVHMCMQVQQVHEESSPRRFTPRSTPGQFFNPGPFLLVRQLGRQSRVRRRHRSTAQVFFVPSNE
jgi:hypothetical protein